jgi:hypothetical protein
MLDEGALQCKSILKNDLYVNTDNIAKQNIRILQINVDLHLELVTD